MRIKSTGRRVLLILAALGSVLALCVGLAPQAGAGTPANQNYVRHLYGDILDRADTTGDAEGVDYWATQLGGASAPVRASIVRQIMFAPPGEYFGFNIQLDYNVYLGRSADTGGYNYFLSKWRSGAASSEDVVVALAGSDEYFNEAGASLDGFVNKAYFDILGREPDASGAAYFKGVAQTRGRASVARLLISSHESHAAEVTYKYKNFLDRDVDPGALAYWTQQRDNGLRSERLDIALVSSDEYYGKNVN